MQKPFSPLGVMLAGGKSSRMNGNDKYKLFLGGKSLFTHIMDRIIPQIDDVIINSNLNKPFENYKVVPDLESHLGPIGGLYSALRHASEQGYEQIITFPCDTPFIPEDYVYKLKKVFNGQCVIASSGDRLHPVLGLWDISLLPAVMTSIKSGEYKLLSFLAKTDHAVCHWDDDPDPFFNINRPDDLMIAESRLLKQSDPSHRKQY